MGVCIIDIALILTKENALHLTPRNRIGGNGEKSPSLSHRVSRGVVPAMRRTSRRRAEGLPEAALGASCTKRSPGTSRIVLPSIVPDNTRTTMEAETMAKHNAENETNKMANRVVSKDGAFTFV